MLYILYFRNIAFHNIINFVYFILYQFATLTVIQEFSKIVHYIIYLKNLLLTL